MKKNFTKQDFYDLLTPNGDCLEWTGARIPTGYGRTHYSGNTEYVHRLAMILEGHNIDGWHVLHSCDNPICCNAKHLRLGTHQENMKDRDSRGRCKSIGVDNIKAKLTVDQVLDVRQQYANGETQTDIAKYYNVKQSTIHFIVKRKTWKHI